MTRGAGSAVRAMLEAESVAVVGASERPGSFGRRMVDEVRKSPSRPEVHLVNPRYEKIEGLRCVASLDDVHAPVDVVLMGVPDSALEHEMRRAARRGDRSAVVFGGAHEPPGGSSRTLRERVADLASEAGMAVCGAGCMGFVNVSSGLRAIGYVEADPVPSGPLALVSCSGSAFSALLRTHRRFGFTIAVSSGQELVTPANAYVDYALTLDETSVVALVLEQMRDPAGLRSSLEEAARRRVPVVALTVGRSSGGGEMVVAHSGALAGGDAAWEALFDSCGVLRVCDLDEMTDTLELLACGRRMAPTVPPLGGGIATVHDSGAERALVVDIAEDLNVRFAQIGRRTEGELDRILDPGLRAENPLDLWGTGSDTAETFRDALLILAGDEEVDAAALCVDLVYEFDGDSSYEVALQDAWDATEKPVALVSNVTSAIDPAAAARLRAHGVPVLEGTRSGLLAFEHLGDLRDFENRAPETGHGTDRDRRSRWLERLSSGPLDAATSLELLADYGIAVTEAVGVGGRDEAIEAATSIGFPVVLKTDEPGVAHKSDVGGVLLGLDSPAEVASAYDDLAARIGRRAVVAETAPEGVELALGIVRDRSLGPIVVVGAGGVLVELLSDRSVGLPPIGADGARRMLDRLAVRRVLDGVRGSRPCNVEAVVRAIEGVSAIACELGDRITEFDVNPLRCGPDKAVAVDALVVTER